MTFSYDAATLGADTADGKKNAVRFLVGDTDTSDQLVQDEEIAFVITRWFTLEGTLEYCAAVVCEVLAAKYAREASYSADGVSIGLAQVGEQLAAQARLLRAQHRALLIGGGPDVGGVDPGEETAYNIKPFDFGTGMHDNLEAGRQAYGSREPYYIAEEEPSV